MLKRCILCLSFALLILVCSTQANDKYEDLKMELNRITEQVHNLTNMQSETHILADAKRAYGFDDNHIIIKNLQENWAILEAEKQCLVEYSTQLMAEMKQYPIVTYDPFETTNRSIEEFNIMLLDSGLEGYGYAFKQMEVNHEVNGVFAISVAMLESGWGKIAPYNNYFGIKNSRFKSAESCIMFFGKLIEENYATLSFSEIAAKYCPSNPKWEYIVRSIMERVYLKIEE